MHSFYSFQDPGSSPGSPNREYLLYDAEVANRGGISETTPVLVTVLFRREAWKIAERRREIDSKGTICFSRMRVNCCSRVFGVAQRGVIQLEFDYWK